MQDVARHAHHRSPLKSRRSQASGDCGAPCTCYLAHASPRVFSSSLGTAAHWTTRIRRTTWGYSGVNAEFQCTMTYLSIGTKFDDREEAWSAFSVLSLPRKSIRCFAASLGFSTWGMWPHCPTCRKIALGSSCCNRCRTHPAHLKRCTFVSQECICCRLDRM
jgi:hypothetical protein